jgi:hypothetical protein
MNSNNGRSLALIGLFTILLASGGTYFWCSIIGGCTFGKYKAEVTFTNLATKEPLASDTVTALIDNSAFFFINIGDPFTTQTNFSGNATIEFDNTFFSPLYISLVTDGSKTKTEFYIQPEDINTYTTISQTKSGRNITGGAESDLIELELKIGNWSLF